MDQYIGNAHRRQSRQLKLEAALNFGMQGSGIRRHSTLQLSHHEPLYLPPLPSPLRNKAIEKRNREFRSKVRAESIAVMRLHLYDENSDLSSPRNSTIKLPKIPNLKSKKSKENSSDPRWNLPNRRVSKHNNKIITEHLRHKLLRQHERRISQAYEDDIQMINFDRRNSTSRESYFEEAVKNLRSTSSKPPSIMNFSSTATSRMDSRRQSLFDVEETAMTTETLSEITHEVKEEIAVESATEFESSRFLSRPSICVSYDSGLTDWINVDDNMPGDDVSSIKEIEPFQMKSKLQKSMNESERSVALLMRKVRRRSTLTEISEFEAPNKDISFPKSRRASKVNLPVISTQQGRTSRSSRRIRSPELQFSPKELPIGDVSLFDDWKDDDTNSNSRAGSFVSDVRSFDIDVTTTISRQNMFVSEPYPQNRNITSANYDQDSETADDDETNSLSSELFSNDTSAKKQLDVISKICLGNVYGKCPHFRQKVCIYLSSAGPDTAIERRYIYDAVVAKLRQFCREKDFSFELIDLNLIPAELATDPRKDISSYLFDDAHDLIEVREKVIENTTKESSGTSFISFFCNTGGIPSVLPSALPIYVMDHILRMLKEDKEDCEMQMLQLKSSINLNTEEEKVEGSSKKSDSPVLGYAVFSPELLKKKISQSGSYLSGASSEKNSNQSKRLIQKLENKLQRFQEQETLLKKWYLLDTNHLPKSYRLKPISYEYNRLAILTNSTTGEFEKGRRENQYWLETQKRLREMLIEFIQCNDNRTCGTSYQPEEPSSHSNQLEDSTVVNANIDKWRGVLWKTPIEYDSVKLLESSILKTDESFFWFKRNIPDLYSQVNDANIRHYLPVNYQKNSADKRADETIQNLENEYKEKFGYSKLREYHIHWNQIPSTLDASSNCRQWTTYLERLALDFYNVCTMQTSNRMRSQGNRNFLQEEIIEHMKFAKNLTTVYIERERIMQCIKQYIRSPRNRRPLILHGNCGSGKSTLMSKAATSAASWYSSIPCRSLLDSNENDLTCRVIFRSIGVTSSSKEPRELLRNVCAQLQYIRNDIRNSEANENDGKSRNANDTNECVINEYDHDFRAMAVKFYKLLSKCGTRQCPVVVFLDNLDALNNHHCAYKLAWLPKRLPKNVKIIVSARDLSPNEIPKPVSAGMINRNVSASSDICFRQSEMFTHLKERYESDLEGSHVNFVFVPSLECNSPRKSLVVPQRPESNITVKSFFKLYLSKQKRNLTAEQMSLITEKCEKCPLPLAAVIAGEISRKWLSSDAIEKCALELPPSGENISQFAHSLFSQMEKYHGRPLVAGISGYISYSVNGVTYDELYCLLSEDKNIAKWISAVFETDSHISTKNTMPAKNMTSGNVCANSQCVITGSLMSYNKRIPMLLFQKIMLDLKFMCLETISDNLLTLKWKHDIYRKVAQSRYFSNGEAISYAREVMAKFFSGNYSQLSDERPKKMIKQPIKQSEITPQCCQPLSWKNRHKEYTNSENDIGRSFNDQANTHVFNLRRLNESSYHYLSVASLDVAKRNIFFNYEWLLAKLRGTSFEALMENIYDALIRYKNDKDIRMLAETLYLSGSILKSDPCQLGPQIVGRLYDIIKRDKPLARMDPRRYPFCRYLIGQCRRSSIPVLTPSGTCLVSPGNIMFDLEQGHLDFITAVVMTTDGHRVITSSKDETIKVWDLMSRRVVLTLHNSSRTVTSLVTCLGNNYVASLDQENTIKLWCLRTSTVAMTISETNDNLVMAPAGEGQMYLVVFYNLAKTIKVWDVDKQRLLHRIDVAPDDILLRDEQVITAGKSSRVNYVLMAYISTDTAYVYNVKRGRISQTIKLQNEDDHTLITHVEVSREYYVIACKRQFMRLHEITNFELYDVVNYGHVRTIKACPDDAIFELLINRLGSHIIALCKGRTGTEVGVWNVETGSHNHIASQKFHSSSGCCIDLQYCVTSSETESTLRIHNLAAKADDKTASRTQVKKKMLGIGEFYPVASNGRYVVARGMENGPITVWNITKGRCKGEAVSIERGLLEKNDVVVVKDVQVVVLTDRGISSVDVGSQQIFKTIFIYDLRTKKYSKKLSPVAITICPRHEYRILAMDKLMAISHDRTHFIVWSLSNGQVLTRIRPDFSKYEPKVIADKSKRKRIKRKKTTTEPLETSQTLTSTDRSRMIDQLLLSDDEGTLLCSFYSRHVAVFDMDTFTHIHTLIDKQSMLLLHQAQITTYGCHLVHTNYNEVTKTSYLTVWSLHQGILLRRLKNEPLVCGLAVSDNASKVVFATEDNFLKIWEPFKKGGHRKIPGYEGLRMRKSANGGQATSVFLTKSSARAILFAHDISLWDIDGGYVIARFTPDIPFQCCTVAMNGNLIIAGLRETSQVVTLRLMSRDFDSSSYGREGLKNDVVSASGLFGEKETRDSESSEDELI